MRLIGSCILVYPSLRTPPGGSPTGSARDRPYGHGQGLLDPDNQFKQLPAP